MKSLALHFALLLTLLVTSTGQGAELLLRERVAQQGAIVRLGDIADIVAASAGEMKSLSNTPLCPAPAVGTRQFLSLAQVRDLLVARGIQMDSLTIKGASVVEISSEPRTSPMQKATVQNVTVQQATNAKPTESIFSHRDVELRVQQAIQLLAENNSTDAGHWRVEVSLNEKEAFQVNQLGAGLAVRGKRKLRSGRQRFSFGNAHISFGNAHGSKDVHVLATLTHIQSVVVVQQQIERGNIVRQSDVKIVEREGNVPSGSLSHLEQVVGQVAQRSFRPKDIVQKSHLRAVWQVRRGETVSVFVRTGGIVVRTRAVAKQDGAMGDLISIEMLADKQRLNVSVSGPGEVAIYATGGQTTEYASLNRGTRRR